MKGAAPEPIVYVAVVDSIGNWVYRLPADDAAAIWPGIGRKTAEARLPAHPVRTPESVNPCSGGYCAVFTSNCQASNVTDARAQGCGFNGDQGFCGNVWNDFADTKQPLFSVQLAPSRRDIVAFSSLIFFLSRLRVLHGIMRISSSLL